MSEPLAYVVVLLAALVASAAVMGTTAAIAARQGRVVVVDVAWGLVFVVMAVVAAAVATGLEPAESARSWVVAGLVGIWGVRLAWHIHGRAHGAQEEDPRYLKVLGGPLPEVGLGVAVRKIFAVQGVAAWLVALPVTVGAATRTWSWWPVLVGAVVVAAGVAVEAVADRQLATYRSRPRDARPQVLDTGLWRYSRHPNYFGDACVWWGIWLAGGLASGWVAAVVTAIGPVVMTWFLVWGTGAKLTERTMMQRPGYPEYAARTSMFVPLPPRVARAARVGA